MSQHDSTSTPPPGARPGPYGGPQTGLSGRGTRFFDWMRALGITRADGWLGGVCAGVAYRLGIDPLIVRGIVVVAAILGAPLLLIYALAWALLPDRDGRIHLQRAFEGDFEPPMVAIGVMILLSLIPWTSGWWFDGPFWHLPGWGEVVGRVVWTLIVLGAGIALIVVAVRNSQAKDGGPGPGWAPGDARQAPGASGAPGSQSSAPTGPSGAGTGTAGFAPTSGADGDPDTVVLDDVSAAAAAPGAATVADPTASAPGAADAPALDIAAEPTAPPEPAQGASPQDVADWRERQAQWRADHAQWKRRLEGRPQDSLDPDLPTDVPMGSVVGTEAGRPTSAFSARGARTPSG